VDWSPPVCEDGKM